MELKGTKCIGISDEWQITAQFCGTIGDFLPLQLIYQGKTAACLPQFKFPDDWHITYTENHSSNEEFMKMYIDKIILPYIWAELKLSEDHPAIAIFDVFKGQQTLLYWRRITSMCLMYLQIARTNCNPWILVLTDQPNNLYEKSLVSGMLK